MTADQAQVTYLKWLNIAHPEIFSKVMARLSVGGIDQLGELGWINFVIQAVAMAGSAVMQKKQIDKQVALAKQQIAASDRQATADREAQTKLALLEVNTKRAQAGLPPVDITGKVIGAATLPTPNALAPYVGGPTDTLIPGVPNYVTYGGAGLALVGLLWALRR